MLKAYITAYPWDLIDNLDRALDHLQGEVGIHGLHLWVSVAPVYEIRAGDVRPRVIRDGGGLTFQPEGGALRGTSWRPIIADWARTREAVGAIVAACESRGLDLRFALSIGEGGRVPLHHPESACVNALGAASQYAACPCDKEVEGYSRAIIDELSRRWGKRTLVLNDLFPAWTDHEQGRWMFPSNCGKLEKSALSVCFCESCCRISAAGGVDVTTARRQAVAIIDRGQTVNGEAQSFTDLLTDTTALAGHLSRQWNEMTALLTRWLTSKMELIVSHLVSPMALASTAPDSFLATPGALLSRINSPAELSSAATDAAKRNELEFSAGIAPSVDAAGLVALLQEVARSKFHAVNVGNYGVTTTAQLEAMRKAIRFARRSGTE